MKFKGNIIKFIFLLMTWVCFVTTIVAQNKSLSGVVMDKAGETLIGATVRIKGSQNGVITNGEGQFLLSNVPPKGVIEVIYLGFDTQTITLKGQATINIYLDDRDQQLQEVVVVGYGTQRKQDLTGAIGQVNVEDIIKAPVGNFDQAMAGRIAGVNVGSSDGQPGETSNFVIRGGNSLTQSTSPLFVVDGFLMEDFSSAAVSTDDIKSISVLKDASSTAIYGARGANGVVVIETKRGTVGKPIIAYTGSVGFQDVTKKMDLMDPYDFVAYQKELKPDLADQYYLANQGLTLEDYRNAKAYNWQDQLFRTALIHNHSLSVRGGTEDTKYSVSGSLFQQDGIIINSGYDRVSGRISLDQNITKKMSVGIIASLADIRTHGTPVSQGGGSINNSSGYALAQAWAFSPATIGNKEIDWDNEFFDPTAPAGHFRVNPVQNIKAVHTRNSSSDVNLKAYLSYEIIKGLTLRVTGGNSDRKSRNEFFYNSNTLYGTPKNPSNSRGTWGGITHRKISSWLNENTLTYNMRFLKKHVLNSMIGATVQEAKSDLYRLESEHIPNEELGMASLGSGSPYRNQTSATLSRTSSFLARANYSYDQKYLVSATFRADGSSKLAKNNKWGYFPSLGLGWRASEEAFLKKNKYISNLKLRASYGVTGNNRIPDFAYLPVVDVNSTYAYSFQDGGETPGAVISAIGNSELKWESTRQIDFGIDLGLFKDRLSIEADIYRKDTYDLLLNAPLPRHTGFTSMMQNIGEIRNEGFELTVNAIPIKTRTFTWESSFNIAFNKNEIRKFVRGRSFMTSQVSWENNYKNPLYLAQVGGPAAVFYGYIHEGNYQYSDFDELSPGHYTLKSTVPSNGNSRESIQPGDIKYRDINGDGVVDASDMTAIGRPTPTHFGGFSNKFTYKNISLSVFLQWSYGNEVFNANRASFEGNALNRSNTNQFKSMNNRWTEDNQTNAIPRAGGHGPIGSYDSRTVEDASFLRLKTVDLEYKFPKKLISKLHLSNLSVNVSGQNLLTFTGYKGMDPEVSTRHSALTPGFDYAAYPRARTVVFGVKVTY